MFRPAHQAVGYIAWPIGASDSQLTVDAAMYGQVIAAIQSPGDSTYLAINGSGLVEVIRVVGWNAGTLTIERGIDNTLPSAFPMGTPIRYILAAAAAQDMVNEAIAGIVTPVNYTFNINAPNTVDVVGNNVNISIPPTNIMSPDGTIDVTGSGTSIGVAVVRGAFGCCEGN